MPNCRRRKFSVKNGLNALDNSKVAHSNSPTKEHLQNNSLHNSDKHEKENVSIKQVTDINVIANTSKNSSALESVHARENVYSANLVKQTLTYDKDVTASSSNIDLFAVRKSKTKKAVNECTNKISSDKIQNKRDGRQMKRDIPRKEMPRHHRVKVRSPKRRIQIPGLAQSTENSKTFLDNTDKQSSTETIDGIDMEDVTADRVTDSMTSTDREERVSSYSVEDNNMCRICHGGETLCVELGALVSACSCRGTVGRVHVKCLERWLTESGKSRCELCGTHYATRRIHRYGVPRGLVMWMLSQNAKQLIVDSLGIMLMSPLAVLAAWLSGRTLAGLMMHESATTPWPLASTFVLACMTLVCYYCWIVSAATRHALGWWIWYRSHYEVRLDMQDNQD